jgi:hypothetical protein
MALLSQLNLLEARGLILLAQIQPEVEYLFRHALVQEAAYHSLVKMDRRRLHRVVGEALERLYAEPAAPELAPVLAQHFAEAGDDARALRYYTLAGRTAAEMYANAEAIHHFGRALEIAQAKAASGDPAVILDLYLRRGHAFELNAQDAEALANYEALEAWAAARGQRAAQLAALSARATIYVKPSVEMNLPLGYALSQQALALARALGDPAAEARVEWNLLQYYLGDGQMAAALAHGEQALALARAHNLREQEAYVLTDLQKAYYQVGEPQRAQAAIETAQALWRDLGVLNMLADNLASTALTNVIGGQYEEALARSDEALSISRTIGNVWNQSYALYTVDLVHFDRGDIAQALAVAQECRRLAEQAGFAEGRNQSDFDLTLIYAYLGAFERAFETARGLEARGAVRHTSPHVSALIAFLHLRAGRPAAAQATLAAAAIPEDEAQLQTWFPLTYLFIAELWAELALVAGRYERVLALTGNLVPYLERIGVRAFRDDAFYLRGRALRALGRSEEARQALTTARASSEALGARRMLWLILAELAALASDDGDETTAQALRCQAADLIDYIAEHVGAADLRAAFLNRPDVQAVLRQAERRPPSGA